MLADIHFRIFDLPVLYVRDVKIKTFETGILSVVLYGCETCFLVLSEDHMLGVFENMVLWGESSSERLKKTAFCGAS
jgi:hypothetical protein